YTLFLGLWIGHYAYRSLLFPIVNRTSPLKMPLIIMLLAFGFNILNSFFNGFALFHLERLLTPGWLLDPRFLVGAALFLLGLFINIQSDRILRGLRKDKNGSYKIPRGGLFRFVSCPNYLGEIIEWSGWAIATWSLAGVSFALWTIANLAPRALAYHAWYKKTFPAYPEKRKALIPFVL
ncbi:MAG TPA: DUF1295 domain-containing protein, partial [Spirochaetia bacterium]|nr:DUF1295 domain-containing protein [Spirochaetia bacterium]